MAGESPLSFGATTSLSATSTTGNAALPTLNSNQIIVTNLGPDLAYIKFGADNTITATTAAYPLLPGTQAAFSINPTLLYLAAITASTTATIKMTAADGLLMGIGAASTGASGGVVDNVNVAQWGGTATTLGQKVMASSVPVAIASNQSAVPTSIADGSDVAEGTTTDAAATAGGTGTVSAKLRRISTQLPAALGQTTASASMPVVLANDQMTTGSPSTAGSALPTKDILYDSTGTALTYNANGQATMVNSTPVVIASNQSAVPVSPQAIATGAASFLNIAAGQATTTVKSGAGTLYAILLNSAATATNTTTIYDNTAASGTVIGRPAATTATVPTTLNYGATGLAFATGLTIITATANGSDMTVVYK